jgi:hypothetical protein
MVNQRHSLHMKAHLLLVWPHSIIVGGLPVNRFDLMVNQRHSLHMKAHLLLVWPHSIIVGGLPAIGVSNNHGWVRGTLVSHKRK